MHPDDGAYQTFFPTTITPTPANIPFNMTPQVVTLSATVASPTGGTVNAGAVTCTLTNPYGPNLTATGNVTGGTATATLLLPADLIAGTYAVSASYAASGGDINYGGSAPDRPVPA